VLDFNLQNDQTMKILNKTLEYVVCASFIIFLISCSKKIELAPLSNVNSANFYKTQEDILQALNAAYAGHRGVYTGKTSGLPPIFQLEEVRADDYDNGNATDDVMGRFLVDGSSEWYRWNWTDAYSAINLANTVIDRAAQVEMDDALRNRYTAEARFLRAHIYFLLVQDYGGIPLVLSETTTFSPEQINIPRSSVDDTYAQIITDLQFAAANLPETHSANDVGRVTSWAAKGMLGKVFLQQGNLAAAETELRAVVNSNLFSLLPEYKDVFSPTNHNHAESLFEIQHKADFAGSPYGNFFATPNWGGAGAGYNYDLPQVAYFLNSFDPADERQIGLTATDGIGNVYSIKYLDPAMTTGFNGNTNFPVLRYADILLMLAEAIGESDEAYGYINQVRDRAGLGDISAASPGTFIDKVMSERRYELAFELSRWHDILRMGPAKAIQTMNDYFAFVGSSTTIDENDLLHPIPVSVVEVTKGVVAQNPGY
jgi:starch-binding outer membrane protein, SusD/RagB family